MSIYLNDKNCTIANSIGPIGPTGPIGPQRQKGISYDDNLYINNSSSIIQLKGKKYEYYDVDCNIEILLPKISKIDNNTYNEYHIFLNFTNKYSIKFDKKIKIENYKEINSGDFVELIITLLKFDAYNEWIGRMIIYNSTTSRLNMAAKNVVCSYVYTGSDILPTLPSEYSYEYKDIKIGDKTARIIKNNNNEYPESINFKDKNSVISINTYRLNNNCTSLLNAFYECNNLLHVNLSEINTSNITDM